MRETLAYTDAAMRSAVLLAIFLAAAVLVVLAIQLSNAGKNHGDGDDALYVPRAEQLA